MNDIICYQIQNYSRKRKNNYSAEPKLWSTEVMKWPKLWTKSWKPKPHSIDFIVIFNQSYELIEVMNYRSYEVNLWTKSKNLRLICNRSYEVKETVNFVFVNDYCGDDNEHVVLVSIKMSERKRNSISIKLNINEIKKWNGKRFNYKWI